MSGNGSYLDSTGVPRSAIGVVPVGDGAAIIVPGSLAKDLDVLTIADPLISGTLTQNADGSFTSTSSSSYLQFDTLGFDGVSLQVTSSATSVRIGWSNSPAGPFTNGPLLSAGNLGTVAEIAATSATSAASYTAPSFGRYCRVTTSSNTTITYWVAPMRSMPTTRAMYIAGGAPLPCINSSGWTETTTPIAAGATFSGASRGGSAVNPNYSYFQAMVYSDQAHTVFIEFSPDGGTTWRPANGAGVAATAGSTTVAKAPVVGAATVTYRVRVVNGATLQTVVYVATSFTTS